MGDQYVIKNSDGWYLCTDGDNGWWSSKQTDAYRHTRDFAMMILGSMGAHERLTLVKIVPETYLFRRLGTNGVEYAYFHRRFPLPVMRWTNRQRDAERMDKRLAHNLTGGKAVRLRIRKYRKATK